MLNSQPIHTVISALERSGCQVKAEGSGWRSSCPSSSHAGGNRKNPALSVSEGGDGKALVHCHGGCTTDEVVEAVGLKSSDLYPPKGAMAPLRKKKAVKRVDGVPPGVDGVNRFPYQTADGTTAICVYRDDKPDGKRFWQYSRDDQGWMAGLGKWKARKRPLYRLPKIIIDSEEAVVLHEGEKATEAAIKARLAGIHTTTIGGAGNAHHSDFAPLKGRTVLVVPDYDEAGDKHAAKVVALAYGAGAKAVRIVQLPKLPPKGDVVEWLEAGGDDGKWRALVKAAKIITPQVNETTQQASESAPEQGGNGWEEPQPLPDTLQPVEAFNPDLLPASFRAFVTDVAERMQCPVDYPAVALMVAIGSMIGHRCAIQPKALDDWLVVPNLWGGLIGRPSLMKSPAMQQALRPLDALINAANKAYSEAVDEFETMKISYEAQHKDWKAKVGKAAVANRQSTIEKPEKPQDPIERRYRTNEGSVECLIQLLNQNPDGLLLMRDELVGWVRGLDRSGREGARQFFLECWNGNGTSFDYDTIAHGHLRCESLCLSVLGTIQPGPLSELIARADQGGGGDDGLIQRFQLMVYPDISSEWKHIDRKPDAIAAKRVVNVFQRLNGDIAPSIHFNSAGQAIFDAWWGELECRIRQEESSTVEAHLAKYRSLMPSLALLIHLVSIAERGETDFNGSLTHRVEPVTADAATKAVRWCDYLESHARRVYAMGINAGMGAAKLLLTRLIEGRVESPFKVKAIKQKGWKGLTTTEQIKDAIGVLETFGWVRLTVEPQQGGSGGRPSEICTLHPNAMHFNMARGNTPLNHPKLPNRPQKEVYGGLEGSSSRGNEKTPPSTGAMETGTI